MPDTLDAKPTLDQHSVQTNVVRQVFCILTRLSCLSMQICLGSSLGKVLGSSCGLASSVVPSVPSRLNADAFDLLPSSGPVDASRFLPPDVKAKLCNASSFFSQAPVGLSLFGGVSKLITMNMPS